MLERIVKKVWLATFLSQVVVSLTLIGASIPDKVVVLTFDDSIKSHHSVVGPLLKRYGFGATFFITEGFDFKTDKEKYMTWEEIAIPEDLLETVAEWREKLIESVAEQDDTLMEKYFEPGIFYDLEFLGFV